MQNEEIQIQFLTEDIKKRQDQLETLNSKDNHRDLVKKDAQRKELQRAIDFDVYRIDLLQRKLARDRFDRLSVENDTSKAEKQTTKTGYLGLFEKK